MMMNSELNGSGPIHKQNEDDTGPLDPAKMTPEQRKMLEKINALEVRLDMFQAEVRSYIRVASKGQPQ
jgi:hypothetical protein